MEAKQDILFTGALNSDDSLEFMPQGDYINLENARNYDQNSDNKLGKLTKIKGTSKITNTKRLQSIVVDGVTYPAILSNAKTIGTVKDSPNNKLYYFVSEVYAYNEAFFKTYYTIYQYDNNLRVITNVVVRTELPIFDTSLKVRFGNVIDGKLTWVQKTIEPKMIEIERAINHYKNFLDQDYSYQPAYPFMGMREFNVIKRPPVDIITGVYQNNPDYITNNIKGKLFQFRHKYIYTDNSESVWGMISTVALPYGEYDANGDYNSTDNFNYIQLTFQKQSYEVKEIWLASRYVDKDGILSNFATFEKHAVSGINPFTDITFDFYNDVNGIVLSDNESGKMLDVVPLAAGTMEVISNPDKIVFGDVKDPIFDNIETDVSIEVIATNIDVAAQDIGTSQSNVPFERKDSLAAYSISGFFTPDLLLNSKGIVSMIKFNDNWIATGAQNITLKINMRVNGQYYTYSTGQLNIIGMTNAQITEEIISRINTDYTTAGGIGVVAYRTRPSSAAADYQVFVNDMNGGASNTDSKKWTGVEDYQLYGNTPAGHCIVFRTGLHMSVKALPEPIEPVLLSCNLRAVVDINNPITNISLAEARKLSTLVGNLFMYHASSDLTNGQDDVLFVNVYPDRDYKAQNFSYYKPFDVYPISILSTYTTSGIQDYGLYIRPTLAPFGKYGVGLVYYDENLRPTFVQRVDDVFINRDDTGDYGYGKPTVYNLRLSINHYPPEQAKYWGVVLTKNLSQAKITEVDLSIDIATPITDDADYIYIDVNKSITAWYELYKNTDNVYEPYVYTRGDRVIIYDNSTSKYVDREIVAVDDDGKIMIQKESLSATDIANIVRFYTPQVRYVDPLYFEIGKIYETIVNKSTTTSNILWHTSDDAIQTSTTPLVIDIPFGDIYVNAINHYAVKTNIGTINSPTYNEFYMAFYPSNLNNYGRSHVTNDKLNLGFNGSRLRISNALIQDSFTMGLSTFDSTDNLDLPKKHGVIQGLAELGYTLKVITETKCISIYVNRTVTVDPNGQEGVLLLNETLGTVAIPEKSFGTSNPNAVIKTNRNLYFLDLNNGHSIRDAANGQASISEFKYASFFKRLCYNLKLDPSTVDFFSAFNKNEYYLFINELSPKFAGIPDGKANVIVFNEELNRWTHHLRLEDSRNLMPEWADNISNNLITFISSELYIHDDTDNYNSFYGNNQESIIEFPFNQDPKQIKLLTGISIHGNNLWDASEDGDIYIEPNATYASGMSSRLKPAKFRKKEGIFYSEFLRNGLTPNMTYDSAIVNGHKLRGNVARIRLRNRDNEKSDLFSVSIKYVNSELSN